MLGKSNINLGKFGGAYSSDQMSQAVIDLTSHNKEDKPIIKIHDNSILLLTSIPETEMNRLIEGAYANNNSIK